MMIAMMVLALALQLPDWAVTDRTDNNTGKREVHATQFSEYVVTDSEYARLYLECLAGDVALAIIWPSSLETDFVPVSIEWGSGENLRLNGRPSAWEVSPYLEGRMAFAPPDDVRTILMDTPEGLPLRLRVHGRRENRTAYFLTEGMSAAYRRVAEACTAA